MNNEQMIKQAYVRGLAARGILRMRAMQKQAAPYDVPLPPGGLQKVPSDILKTKNNVDPAIQQLFSSDPSFNPTKNMWSRGAIDALAGVGGAGIGAIIGALVAYAHKKKILGHALAGAGIGGLAGVGGSELYQYLNKKNPEVPWRLEWELSKIHDNPLTETDEDRANKAGIKLRVNGLHDDPFSDPDIYNQVDSTVSPYTA